MLKLQCLCTCRLYHMFRILNGIQHVTHVQWTVGNPRTKENPHLKKEGNYSSQTHRTKLEPCQTEVKFKGHPFFSVSLWKSKNSVLLPQRKWGRKFGYYMCVCTCTFWDKHLKTTEPFRCSSCQIFCIHV